MTIIHQIFIDIGKGKTYLDNDIYKKCVEENKKQSLKHKIWNEKMLDNLCKEHYPEYLNFWNSFPHPFWKIDFGRYMILHHEGGIYIDMDDLITEPIKLDRDIVTIFKRNNNRIEFGNNIIHFQDRNNYKRLMDFCLDRYKTCRMPKEWKQRRFFFIVGQRAYHSFVKYQLKLKMENTINFNGFDTNAWLFIF